MKCVILAGGKGTRLSEETLEKPKPLVEIGGKPVLWHIMKIYSHYGIKDFVICLGYKGDMIRDYFKNISNDENWNCTFVDTGQETMTGGRLKRIQRYDQHIVFFEKASGKKTYKFKDWLKNSYSRIPGKPRGSIYFKKNE